jgi:hypothetical protein
MAERDSTEEAKRAKPDRDQREEARRAKPDRDKKTSRERRWPIPYLDLSNTLFFFFVALFAIALLAISDADEKKKVDTTSKLLVTLTWRDGSANDVDLSMKVPNGEVVWFRNRQAAFASLDHDNLGIGNTTVLDGDGKPVISPGRDEVIYIRQTMPGTYIVNVHLYALYGGEAEPVSVTLASVDPTYRQVVTRQLNLTDKHEEHTAFRFTVDDQGNVTSTDLVEELFINDLLGTTT